MIVLQYLFAIAVIFSTGRFLLNLKYFDISGDPLGEKVALYFHAGAAAIGLYMFLLAMLHVKFNVLFISAPFVIYGVYFISTFRPSGIRLPAFTIKPTVSFFLLLIIIAVLASMTFNCFISPVEAKDAVSIWFFKAKIFFVERTVPIKIMDSPAYYYSHSEYPLLLPLNLAWISICLGEWNDILLRLFFALSLVLSTIYFYSTLKRRTGSFFAMAATFFWVTNFHTLSYAANGYADIMLACFAFTAVSFFLRWAEEKKSEQLNLCALFAGASVFIKNDGIAILAGLAIALIILLNREKRDLKVSTLTLLRFAIIACVIFLPFKLVAAFTLAPSHMIENANFASTFVSNLSRIPVIISFFLYEMYLNTYTWNYFWIFITILIVMQWKQIKRSSVSYAFWTVVAAMSVYFLVYVLTALDIHYHLMSSFHRLLLQLAPTAVLVAFSTFPKETDQ